VCNLANRTREKKAHLQALHLATNPEPCCFVSTEEAESGPTGLVVPRNSLPSQDGGNMRPIRRQRPGTRTNSHPLPLRGVIQERVVVSIVSKHHTVGGKKERNGS
jgi:hypothetical protein